MSDGGLDARCTRPVEHTAPTGEKNFNAQVGSYAHIFNLCMYPGAYTHDIERLQLT